MFDGDAMDMPADKADAMCVPRLICPPPTLASPPLMPTQEHVAENDDELGRWVSLRLTGPRLTYTGGNGPAVRPWASWAGYGADNTNNQTWTVVDM